MGNLVLKILLYGFRLTLLLFVYLISLLHQIEHLIDLLLLFRDELIGITETLF